MAFDHKPHHWLSMVIMVYLLVFLTAASTISADTNEEILIRFKKYLSNDTALDNWNASVALCINGASKSKWSGVVCYNGSFYGLKLEKMGLAGLIDVETLAELSTLHSFSVMNNNFGGPVPEVSKLRGLKALFLSGNHFAGEIKEDAFKGMRFLKKVHLARNEFIGKVPKSLAALTRIMELDLRDNQFVGRIPAFRETEDWKVFNVSNNRFQGRIPSSLSKADPSSFAGNKDLCGKPLVPCKSSSKKRIIIVSIVVALVAILAIIATFIFIRARKASTSESKLGNKKKSGKAFGYADGKEVDDQSSASEHYSKYKTGTAGNGALTFVRNDRERFGLEDLLRASAEVLGSGSFGSSYKAVLLNGPAMVVKRFRRMNNLGKEEFHEHMTMLGSLSHPNLHPLVAYYYRKEEKLLVSNFVANGSLASHLHGRKTPGRTGLDWPTRLNIIKGVARGLAYLYTELPGLTLPHGHLKSSNVLLDHNYNPLLTEYALVPVVSKDHAQQFMAAYKSPEYSQYDKTTNKSDVWSLGILILEMLTGKFPEDYVEARKRSGNNSDLATWVNSVVREEWTGEVFDKDMNDTKNGESELLKLLKIGLCCSEASVDLRWDLREALERIEELKERETDEEYSSYASDWDIYSSRAMTDDEFSFSIAG